MALKLHSVYLFIDNILNDKTQIHRYDQFDECSTAYNLLKTYEDKIHFYTHEWRQFSLKTNISYFTRIIKIEFFSYRSDPVVGTTNKESNISAFFVK